MKKPVYNITKKKHFKTNMSTKSKQFLQLSTEKGVSSWLTMLPVAKYDFKLSR